MHEIINQILEGNFDYENGSLDFSCAKIELALQKGMFYEGTFMITAAKGRFVNGFVYTSDYRMECLTPEFTGSEAEIAFCFHGENMEEGDVVKGVFWVVSNQGEYYLPFVVSVEHTVLESSIGAVKNLFHFANLAKSNWQEAVKLFYSPEFPQIFVGNDMQHYDGYRGLSAYPGNEQNMEEFLIQINKKQKVEFIPEETAVSLDIMSMDGTYAVLEKSVGITRNGWGYTRLLVECEGDFLFTEKEVLTDDDFLGNYCRLPIYIDRSMCRNGKNFGRVFLHNSYVSLTITVQVMVGEGNVAKKAQLTAKRSVVQLLEAYQAFRMKKITTAAWLKETGKLVEKLIALNEKDVSARLFKAQLLITEERYNEANWLLEHARELLDRKDGEQDILWAYYWYLTTLIRREEEYVNQVAARVERIYRKNRTSWRVAWLLLYLSEEYNKSATVKWQFLKEQFLSGCNSSIIYIEALLLINANPTLLRKLDGFGLQVLYYGAKQEMLGAELTEQLLYLTGKVKEYSPVLYKTLEKLYQIKPDVRILQEICTLLIKGGKTGQKYFHWYQSGVEAQLRITNLYEYFMMSLDLEKTRKLPRIVLLYFSYQNNLDYIHSAYLYDYILQNSASLGELYGNYRVRIEHFMLEQIKKEHINRHLANLYKRLLSPDMINEQTAVPLAKLLFAHRIQVEDLRLKKVFVYQPDNSVPTEYVLADGQTWVALYGNEYTIVFEDAWGNRFIKDVEYTLEKLMLAGKYIRMVAHYVKDLPKLDLYLYESDKDSEDFTQESLDRVLRIVASEEVFPVVRKEIYLKLLKYYYEADDMRALDEYLECIPVQELNIRERALALKYLVLRGNYDLAYEWLVRYDPYFADINTLVRLVSERIFRTDMMEDQILSAAAVYAFRQGKYDGNILRYLTLYFKGMIKDMRDIWKAARAFDIECYNLCERILVQMLYSGAFVGEKMDIFRYYVSQGAKQEVEEAFLSQCAYDYFVRERITESYVFEEIQNMHQRNEQVQKICKLAFLKYYAENKEDYSKTTRGVLEIYLREMMREKIHLNFFKELKEFDYLIQELSDKTIIEYSVRPGGKAKIHYVVLHDNGEAEEYLAEYMRDVYGGVCFKEFVLFFGETLQYYIMEECDGEEQLTESGNVQKSDIRNESDNSKYNLINDMVISKTLQDYDTLDSLLEEYYRKEYYNEQLFKLL